MDIKNILNVGTGRTGNAIVDEMMSKDKRYTGMLINSSESDMVNLDNYERAIKFLIPGATGSGRDRTLAEKYAKDNVYRFADEIVKYDQFELFVFYFSLSGGTGSGATIPFIRALRKVMGANKKIMVVGVMPSNYSSKVELENTLQCWDELMKLRDEKVVNGFRFIDNDKRETLVEINKIAVLDLDTSFKLNTFDVDGTIDQKDSLKINSANDYTMVYNLSNSFPTLKDAIDNYNMSTVFVPPTTLDCDYLGVMLQEGKYGLNEARKLFNVYETDYIGNSNGRNVIVASGMNIPVSKIEKIQIALSEINTKVRSRVKDSSLYTSRSNSRIEEKEIEIPKKKNNSISSDELNRLFDDSFWN